MGVATDHFTYKRVTAEYVDRSPDPARTCAGCDLFTDKRQWQRCDKGGFFVRPGGTCKHFTPITAIQPGATKC